MNPNNAIQFAKLIEEAYTVAPDDLTKPDDGAIISIDNPVKTTYTIISKIYGNDLGTDINPERAKMIVSFGYLLQDDAGNVVVVIRGTKGIWEWLHDAMFMMVPCPIKRVAGFTEDGFTAIFNSLTLDQTACSVPLAQILATVPFKSKVTSITVSHMSSF